MSVMPSSFKDEKWRGTGEELAKELRGRILQLRLKVTPPTVRTIRLWRARHVVTQSATGDFCYRQVLEALATALLLTRGWTLVAIGELLASLEDIVIESNILTEATGAQVSWIGGGGQQNVLRGASERRRAVSRAEDAVVLLAQGILRQY